MNGDRNLRLSHVAVEKNNPGLSSNEEKSQYFFFQQMFSQWERSVKTAVAACFALFLYSRVFFFIYLYRVMTNNKTSPLAEEIINTKKYFVSQVFESLSGCFMHYLNLRVEFDFFQEVPNNKVNSPPNKIM